MDRRRALLIIIIVVACVGVALAIFYFFTQRTAPTPEPGGTYPIGENLPFGNGNGTGNTGSGDTTTGGFEGFENKPQTFEQKLRLISSLPVSGATLYDKNTETYIRYVERAKGNVFETVASKNEEPKRISNTTIPKIQEAYWVRNGEGVVLRYLKDSDEVLTYYASIKPAATSSEQVLADGTFLSNNITSVGVSPTKDRIFYLVNTADTVIGIRANPNGTARTQLFSSPAHEWLVSWPKSGTIALTTKPSSQVPGALYFLDSSSGAFKRVLGGVNGLTTLSNSDASAIFYSESTFSGFVLKLLSLSQNQTTQVGVNTLPEKCVWSAKQKEVAYCAVPDTVTASDYPDAWYQGRVSFVDNIWKVNTKTGQTTMILSPQSVAKTTMDVINLTLSDNEKYLLFTNKKDLSLWLLTLEVSPPAQAPKR